MPRAENLHSSAGPALLTGRADSKALTQVASARSLLVGRVEGDWHVLGLRKDGGLSSSRGLWSTHAC